MQIITELAAQKSDSLFSGTVSDPSITSASTIANDSSARAEGRVVKYAGDFPNGTDIMPQIFRDASNIDNLSVLVEFNDVSTGNISLRELSYLSGLRGAINNSFSASTGQDFLDEIYNLRELIFRPKTDLVITKVGCFKALQLIGGAARYVLYPAVMVQNNGQPNSKASYFYSSAQYNDPVSGYRNWSYGYQYADSQLLVGEEVPMVLGSYLTTPSYLSSGAGIFKLKADCDFTTCPQQESNENNNEVIVELKTAECSTTATSYIWKYQCNEGVCARIN